MKVLDHVQLCGPIFMVGRTIFEMGLGSPPQGARAGPHHLGKLQGCRDGAFVSNALDRWAEAHGVWLLKVCSLNVMLQ